MNLQGQHTWSQCRFIIYHYATVCMSGSHVGLKTACAEPFPLSAITSFRHCTDDAGHRRIVHASYAASLTHFYSLMQGRSRDALLWTLLPLYVLLLAHVYALGFTEAMCRCITFFIMSHPPNLELGRGMLGRHHQAGMCGSWVFEVLPKVANHQHAAWVALALGMYSMLGAFAVPAAAAAAP